MLDKDRAKWQQMREDRPLDALFPELLAPSAPNDDLPSGESSDEPLPVLYPKILEVELEKWQEWTMALWRKPDSPEELEAELSALIEATLLLELSRPPGWGGAAERSLRGFHLFAFAEIDGDCAEVLARYGFTRVTWDEHVYGNRLHAWKNEGRALGASVPGAPRSLWWSEFASPNAELQRKVRRVHEELAERLGARIWGERPGAPSHTMASLLERHFQLSCKPDLETLHSLDMLLIERQTDAIRWLEPMVFQGLCDFVGVLLMALRRREVKWGACESDRQGGHLPPLLRYTGKKGPVDVAIGRELLRVAIMPIAREEDAPLLRDWFDGLMP